jgi:hypothetical protein
MVKYLFYSAEASWLIRFFMLDTKLIFKVWTGSESEKENVGCTAELSVDQGNVKAIYILETLWTFHHFPWSTGSISDKFQCFCDKSLVGTETYKQKPFLIIYIFFFKLNNI